MPDFDADFGAFGDPNPPGTTTAIGDIGANDPLIDWASNLSKDDLAKFLQDPQGHAQDMASRGIPPPPTDAMHDHNEMMGTPSRSDRFAVQPASPLDAPPTYRVNPATGRLYNLTSDINDQARAAVGGQPASPMTRSFAPSGGLMGGDPNTPEAAQPTYPKPPVYPREQTTPAPEAPAPTPSADRRSIFQRIQDALPQRAPATPAQAAPAQYPAPGSLNPKSPAFIGPQPPIGDSLNPPAAPEAAPPAAPKEDTGLTTEDKPKVEKTKLQKVDDALSDLGKAMQGVKAPPPLQPPQIGAPHVRAPNTISPQLMQLLQARQGTTPGSALPSLLRMLGR